VGSAFTEEQEAVFVKQSNRTGGYEIPRGSDFVTGDDDTVPDHSIYTLRGIIGGRKYGNDNYEDDGQSFSTERAATVISTATTVKQSSGSSKLRKQQQYQQRQHGNLSSRPVLQTGDICLSLERYQNNRQSQKTHDSKQAREGGKVRENKKNNVEQSVEQIHATRPSPTSYRFEFDDTTEKNFFVSRTTPTRMNNNGDDDMSSASVHSISYSETDDEMGFEVEEEFLPSRAVSSSLAYDSAENKVEASFSSHDTGDDDSPDTLDVTYRQWQREQHDILDGRSSPGAVRLTAEGLQCHEKKTFLQARKQPEQYTNELEAWRKEHETRRWYNQQLKDRAAQRLSQPHNQTRNSGSSTGSHSPMHRTEMERSLQSCNTLTEPRSAGGGWRSCTVTRSESGASAATESTTEKVTMASLLSLQRLGLHGKSLEEGGGGTNTKPKPRFPLFRKRVRTRTEETVISPQRERQDTWDESPEETLQVARLKGIVSGNVLTTNRSVDTHPLTTASSSLSTSSTTTTTAATSVVVVTPTMPNCVLCRTQVRTHIATPCMHFSFCANCAGKLRTFKEAVCPVCHYKNVKFVQVEV
jgi:hypothetical protein